VYNFMANDLGTPEREQFKSHFSIYVRIKLAILHETPDKNVFYCLSFLERWAGLKVNEIWILGRRWGECHLQTSFVLEVVKKYVATRTAFLSSALRI